MERVVAQYLLPKKTDQERMVYTLLKGLNPPLRKLDHKTAEDAMRFALFVRPGRFMRFGRSVIVRRKTLLRISTNPACFYENGTCTIPTWARNAHGYIGLTELTDWERSDPAVKTRLEDALREACRQANRLARVTAARKQADERKQPVLLLGVV